MLKFIRDHEIPMDWITSAQHEHSPSLGYRATAALLPVKYTLGRSDYVCD